MKKFFTVLLVLIIVVGVGGYFGVQWKVNDSVEKAFASIPFTEASFSDANLDLNGRLVINNVELYIPFVDTTIDIRRISVATSNLKESLLLEYSLKEGVLPRSVRLNVSEFSVAVDPEFAAAMGEGYQADIYSQITALGCGRNLAIGPQQLFDMGVTDLTFDFTAGYTYDMPTDELSSTFDWSLDGIGRFALEQTSIGLGPLMNNYQNALFGFDPASVSTTDLTVRYADNGYNALMQDYCATSSGLARAPWVEQHLQMVGDVFSQVSLDADVDLLGLYQQLLTDNARLVVNLRPLPGFRAADLQFYGIPELIELVNLQVSINDNQVEIGQLNWDQDRLDNLNLAGIRSEYRQVLAEPESPTEGPSTTATSEPANTLERILREVRVQDLEQHVNRTVQLTRNDGQVFTGVMTSVTADRVVVRSRYQGGFTDLPLQRARLAVAKLYPE